MGSCRCRFRHSFQKYYVKHRDPNKINEDKIVKKIVPEIEEFRNLLPPSFLFANGSNIVTQFVSDQIKKSRISRSRSGKLCLQPPKKTAQSLSSRACKQSRKFKVEPVWVCHGALVLALNFGLMNLEITYQSLREFRKPKCIRIHRQAPPGTP